jgi:hypothetical protein
VCASWVLRALAYIVQKFARLSVRVENGLHGRGIAHHVNVARSCPNQRSTDDPNGNRANPRERNFFPVRIYSTTTEPGVVHSVLGVAPNESWMASASFEEVRVWDPTTGTELTSLRVAGRLVHLGAWDPWSLEL